jgi:double zinc ribbon protein
MTDVLAGLGLSEDVLTIVAIYGVIVLAAFWLAMVVWAYRDMRSRSRDTFAQLGVAVMVALLLLPGLLIYVLLRPRETLGDAYERSLEEEALLQEIEEKPTCPGCGQRVRENWQACPHCYTRLKKPCVNCRQMLELSWQICPYCAAPQPGQHADQPPPVLRHVRPITVPEEVASTPPAPRSSEPLEFVEGDDY